MVCVSATAGVTGQGAGVFPSFSGCRAKGLGPAHRFRIRQNVGGLGDLGQMVRPLGAFVSLFIMEYLVHTFQSCGTRTETVQARCLVGLFSGYKYFIDVSS